MGAHCRRSVRGAGLLRTLPSRKLIGRAECPVLKLNVRLAILDNER